MNTQPETIKQSQLLNRLVLDRRTAEEVGRVEQLWLDPQNHQVVGLTCKSGFLGSKKRTFSWAQVETIGIDSVLVNMGPEVVDSEKPESAVALMGHEVWTDAGNKVGKLVDYLLVSQTGAVTYYLFVSSGWRGVLDGLYLLSPTAVISTGSKRVIVADAVVQTPQQYAEGFNQKVTQAAEYLKEDYKKTQSDLEAMRRGAQNLAEQVKETTEEVTNKAKDKIAEVKARQQEIDQSAEVHTTIDTTVQPAEAEQPIEMQAQLLPSDPDVE